MSPTFVLDSKQNTKYDAYISRRGDFYVLDIAEFSETAKLVLSNGFYMINDDLSQTGLNMQVVLDPRTLELT